jgi:hypothetical protein
MAPHLLQIFIQQQCPALNSVTDNRTNRILFHVENYKRVLISAALASFPQTASQIIILYLP